MSGKSKEHIIIAIVILAIVIIIMYQLNKIGEKISGLGNLEKASENIKHTTSDVGSIAGAISGLMGSFSKKKTDDGE